MQESVISQVSQDITLMGHMVSHDKSHERCGKIVHRLCSSYISSIENLMRTPLSSSYQLR